MIFLPFIKKFTLKDIWGDTLSNYIWGLTEQHLNISFSCFESNYNKGLNKTLIHKQQNAFKIQFVQFKSPLMLCIRHLKTINYYYYNY